MEDGYLIKKLERYVSLTKIQGDRRFYEYFQLLELGEEKTAKYGNHLFMIGLL